MSPTAADVISATSSTSKRRIDDEKAFKDNTSSVDSSRRDVRCVLDTGHNKPDNEVYEQKALI